MERLLHGVYRMGGAPALREEDVLATWLSIDPSRQPGAPLSGDSPVVMGATAAWVLRIGDVGPTPYEFCVAERKQTQRGNVRLRKRRVDLENVTIVSGLPTTTATQTVLDLIDSGEDLSLVANVLNDALAQGLIYDETRLREEVDKRGVKEGFSADIGLYEVLVGGIGSR